jgi:hypothetical protein
MFGIAQASLALRSLIGNINHYFHYFGFAQDRRRFGIKNKQVCFVLLSASTTLASPKIGGASTIKINKFILYCVRLALSLQH